MTTPKIAALARRVGGRVRRARETVGISQHTLGVRCDVTDATVANWEAGRTSPRATDLLAIAAACGCSAAWLLDGSSLGPVQTASGQ
jgi:transcriptional regulator with XRE-family HTH domain